MLHTLLLFVHFFCAAAIVALVLLQRGKGAEAGAGFGAGASGTVFGARGASTALSRTTAILAAVFMLTSLSLAYVSTHGTTTSNTLLDRLSQQNSGHAATVPGFPPPTAPIGPHTASGAAAAPAAPASPGNAGAAGQGAGKH